MNECRPGPSLYGHMYLTSYGWTGSGTGLRKAAFDMPLAILPKKNISGLGKGRDEAFPFWDQCVPTYLLICSTSTHDVRPSLFTIASKAITIKLSSDDKDTDDDDESKVPREGDPPSSDPLHRTTTGILSNRRPASESGTPTTTSGSTTPNPNPTAHPPSSSLLVIAKREAAKRGLYARFFRGPVLGPDNDGDGPSSSSAAVSSPSPSSSESSGSAFVDTSTSESVSASRWPNVSAIETRSGKPRRAGNGNQRTMGRKRGSSRGSGRG